MNKNNKIITRKKFDDGKTPFRLEHEEVTVTRYLNFSFKELQEFYQEHIENEANPEDMHILPSFIHDAFESSKVHDFPHKFSGQVSYKLRHLACEGNAISSNWIPDLGNKVMNLKTQKGKLEVIMRLAILQAEMEDMVHGNGNKSVLLKLFPNFIGRVKLRSGDEEEIYVNEIGVVRKTVTRAAHPVGAYGSAHSFKLGAGYQTFLKTEYQIKD
ncbi:MAG: hypothetical protein KBD29_04750 [Candidatus Magasanikbacteria bacterium]|nr:hypothetical protein [Candidatus Magasanikbacteria bacterium]